MGSPELVLPFSLDDGSKSSLHSAVGIFSLQWWTASKIHSSLLWYLFSILLCLQESYELFRQKCI